MTILRNGGGESGGGYLSDMPWTSELNGWGPAERDRSNGELGDNDGGRFRSTASPMPKASAFTLTRSFGGS